MKASIPESDVFERAVVFIINPVAGTHHRKSYIHAIHQYFKEDEYLICTSDYCGHAYQLAKEKVDEGYKRIVAVGGDGTVNEVATALVGTEAVLGIVPVGSGNGLARYLGISTRITESMAVIRDFRVKRIDAGCVNDHFFFSTCGTGFDAIVGKEFADRSRRGIRTYLRATIHQYIHYKPKKYILNINKKKIELDAFLINFANAGQYGYNAYIAPNARVDDGKLDLCILRPFPKTSTLSMGLRLFFKNIDQSPYLEMMRVKKASLKRKGNKKIVLHLDGEPLAFRKMIRISVVSKAVRVMVPLKRKRPGILLHERLVKAANHKQILLPSSLT